MLATILWCLLIISLQTVASEECNIKLFDDGNIVCVCDSTSCDTVTPLQDTPPERYQLYTTSKSVLGLVRQEGEFVDNTPNQTNAITIDRTVKYQSIIGFGGAFTDSAGINIVSLPTPVQNRLLESYFGPSGIEYSFCRVPIGGTDFSTRPYSYDDNPGDTTLENFQLQPEDFQYKIPMIHMAKELRGENPLRFFASVWTAPPWMKTNNEWAGVGVLKDEYYQLWADYFMKFFDSYRENAIEFWGVTTQNEPLDGFLSSSFSKINAMGYTPETMNKWIGEYLGPTIRNSSYKDLKIITFDDNRVVLALLPEVLENELSLSYLDGVAAHWYEDWLLPTSLLEFTRSDKKDLFLIASEACNGYLNKTGVEKSVDLGSWPRAERYIRSIYEYLEFGAAAWVDWNLVLDMGGGPTFISNFVDAPIIADPANGQFYKQPMYYALGHFSKFIIPDSVRIAVDIGTLEGVQALGFLRPDNRVVVVIYNSNLTGVQVQIQDVQIADIFIEPQSINTLIYEIV